MRTAVVTGATGFIGGWLVRALARQGVSVTAITRRPVASSLPGAAHIRTSGERRLPVVLAEAGPDIVFHLAGMSGEEAARRDPALALEANCRAVWTMLDAVHRSGCRPVIVLASSVAVYGETMGRPAVEDDPLRGTSPYELSKIAAETAARCFAATGLRVRIARIGNVFGPGDRSVARLIPDTIAAIREGRAPVLHAPASMRGHLHVADCARGLIALGSAAGSGLDGRAVNLCQEVGITNMDLVRLMLAQSGRDDLRPVRASLPQPASVRLASAALAREALGWRPEITLQDGLADLLERPVA